MLLLRSTPDPAEIAEPSVPGPNRLELTPESHARLGDVILAFRVRLNFPVSLCSVVSGIL